MNTINKILEKIAELDNIQLRNDVVIQLILLAIKYLSDAIWCLSNQLESLENRVDKLELAINDAGKS
ncbi:MAG: hypothetical protein QW789_03490 [Nitrososphaerota archaeon]